jgi:hypothetical protein
VVLRLILRRRRDAAPGQILGNSSVNIQNPTPSTPDAFFPVSVPVFVPAFSILFRGMWQALFKHKAAPHHEAIKHANCHGTQQARKRAGVTLNPGFWG